MLSYLIIKKFEGKHVEVSTVRKEFTGTLKYDVNNNTLIVDPVDPWIAKRYGAAVIAGASVVSIREVKPYKRDDCDDCEDDCEKENPKAVARALKAKEAHDSKHAEDKLMVIPNSFSDDVAKDAK